MKKISLLFFILLSLISLAQKENKKDTVLLQPIEIKSVRANDKAPFTKINISQSEIEKENLGQDLPFILNQIPSVVINSDAGNGVGYTGIHVRGSDATRINMTLNGIPYNDAESQGIYFVDLPDIVSSVNSIQLQRGVGTSSNGAGAFGATLNLSTNDINDSMYAEINNSYGSFNTWKNTIKIASGLLGKHFTIDARISSITSDGYIDRASSNLKSFYISGAYITANNSLRFNIFSGKEKTYQAWYGVPENLLDSDRTYNPAGTEKPGTPYSNETDNYWQTHYQLFYNHKINSEWAFNDAVFLTRGYGYYEEYRAAQNFSDYGLPDYQMGNQTLTSTDLIRQLWLDNYFYGTIFSAQKQTKTSQFTFGGGWDKYDGKHYGIVTWAQYGFPANYYFYNVPAHKQDFTIYAKLQQQLSQHLQGFGDIQLRAVNYNILGFEDNPTIIVDKNYFFINPKLGFTYTKNNYQAYLSYSMADKEPNRDDFEANLKELPTPEILHDVELGAEKRTLNYSYGATFYYMYYHNQLILTGKINDVGAYTRTNVPSSFRAGIELEGKANFLRWLNVSANLAFSKNKIKAFTEYIDNYDNGLQNAVVHHNTDISFSPNVVAGTSININLAKEVELSLLSKYVGREFLDNTSNLSRSLKPFYVQDARFSYRLKNKMPKKIDLILQVNNIFNKKYEPNGYTYSYISGGNLSTENNYFPMAGTNFMAAINIKF